MNYEFKENKVIINNPEDFSLAHTFDCGQCFRFNLNENGNYTGIAFNKVVEISEENGNIIIENLTEDEFYKNWIDFLDLSRNYKEIKDSLIHDEVIKKAIEFGRE